MDHVRVPRFMGSAVPFCVVVIVVLAWLAFRGCGGIPLTATQRAAKLASLEERQAAWDEARDDRDQRSGFDLAMYFLSRLAGLVLAVGAGLGLISSLTLYGWRKAATVSPVGGLYPLVISKLNGSWRVFDANRSPVASVELSSALVAPGWEAVQLAAAAGAQRVQMEQARGYSAQAAPTADAAPAPPPAGEDAPVVMNWPGRVPLVRYLEAQGGASMERVFLGVTCDPATGEQVPVRMAMDDLVHFAVAGSSGFGKTVFVNALLYQFVKSQSVDVAVVDMKGELTPWGSAEALRWPIATTRGAGGAILAACYEELEARKAAFEAVGGASDLADYNARANGAGRLRPLVAVLDEGTVLLRKDRALVDKATDLVLMGRSFGLWLVLAAQNFKVSSAASEIRDQLTSRFQFHAQDGSQARILLGHARAQGLGKGRAIVRLSGYAEDIELQAPIVTRQEIDVLLRGQRGPRNSAPAPVVVRGVKPVKGQPIAKLTANQEARALELGGRGETTTTIMKDIWGKNGKSGSRANAINALLGRE